MSYIWNDPLLKERRQELRRSQTDAEKALWKRIRAKQLNGRKFFRQYSVGPYILDFYCPMLKLAIELDGGQHTYDENRDRDHIRTECLKRQGIHVIRFWNHDVLQHIDAVVEKVSEEMLVRPTPPVNSP
jgi:very-short-patch-repair endonuclease